MKEAADIFYMSDKEFTNKLDESPHLLGFENGIYDLDAMEFRAGRPNDFLTLSTGYNYTPESDTQMRMILQDLIKSIYGTDEMVKYMMQFGAYILHGSKTEEIIHFWVGKGGNGKGIMDKLFDACLGDYYYQPDASIFTGSKKSSSAANSEIAKGKGKRLWCMTEPGTDDKFNTAELKKKSGRDRIQARALYKNFVEYIAQMALVFHMNNKSSLDSYDGGMLRRLRLIEYKNQFVSNPTKPHEYQKDETLKDHFKDNEAYRQEFMRMLIESYVEVKTKGKVPTPQSVVEYTKEYIDSNNVVGGFLSEFCDITNNKDDIIQAGKLYQAFKASHFCNGKNQQQFKEAMNANGHVAEKITTTGQYHNNMVYRGIAYKEDMEVEVDDPLDKKTIQKSFARVELE
jgi:P4 family phage/plasmid primase-like protien